MHSMLRLCISYDFFKCQGGYTRPAFLQVFPHMWDEKTEYACLAMIAHEKLVLQWAVCGCETACVNLWIRERNKVLTVPALKINGCEFATTCLICVMQEEGSNFIHVGLDNFRGEFSMTIIMVSFSEFILPEFLAKDYLSIDAGQKGI